jgi:hypothetical protein
VAHVFVALADNAHQGIVPVPAVLGNGDDPERNLYWGAAFGVRTFFKKSAEWKEVAHERSGRAGHGTICVLTGPREMRTWWRSHTEEKKLSKPSRIFLSELLGYPRNGK